GGTVAEAEEDEEAERPTRMKRRQRMTRMNSGHLNRDLCWPVPRAPPVHPVPQVWRTHRQRQTMKETIPIAADHAGFDMKEKLARKLRDAGFKVDDLGTHSSVSTDYPEYAHRLASLIEEGKAERGVLLCGTGLGMAYAANRHRGVRAAVAWNAEVARLAREHNDANVLVLPSRCVSDAEAERILDSWLEARFEGGRHTPRVQKIELPESDR
ncbi:MAG: ribose 5-phosphate isomerase B, partial [Gemmatimonadota bacterium]